MQLLTDFANWLALQPTTYQLLLAISGLLLFTIGLLIGYLLQRSKTRKALRQLAAAERERTELQRKLDASEEEQKNLAREVVSLTSEKDDALVRVRDVTNNLTRTSEELRRVQAANEQLRTTNQTYASTIEDLNDQIIGLKTRNEQLLGGNGDGSTVPPSIGNDFERRLRALEMRLERLTDGDTEATDPPVNLGEPRHQVRIGEPAGMDIRHRDDLTKIRAIGPFNQRQLNEAGVYTYRQIADWSDDDLEVYAARIGYVAEIMREEDWIGQAASLAEDAVPMSNALVVPDTEADAEDLTVIEGIRPQTASVLQDSGVRDLEILAKTPVNELQAMLEQAGEPYALHRVLTWPEQAALAAAGEWDRLRELQEELRSGRPV